ncbi:hypothetical protein V8D89_003775 [Ganoderma adspersum]
MITGMTYFIALSILNILHLIFTKLSIATDGETSLMTAFTAPLSSVFVSHFLLDLQECHQRTVIGLATGDLPHTSQSFDVSSRSVHFARALGSLQATLRTPDDYDLKGDEEGVEDWSGASNGGPRYGREVIRDSRIEDELDVTEVPCGDGDGGAVGV